MDPKQSPLFKWWQGLPRSSQVSIIVTSLLLLIAIPLSVQSALTEVSVTPDASENSGGFSGSKQNLLFGDTNAVIDCAINTECSVSFTGESKNLDALLSMDVDFLPTGLTPSQCLPLKSATRNQVSCGFEGVPQKTGRYKIQVTLNDSQGQQQVDVYTLQIR